MARRPSRPQTEDDELGKGIGEADDDEDDENEGGGDDTIKIIEPPPNENRSGIVVEDADLSQGTAVPPEGGAAPATPAEPEKPTLSESAQATLDAEMALGKKNVALAKGEAKKAEKAE